MQITKREFLKKLGLGGAAVATGAAFADQYVATTNPLPPGSVGDPEAAWFGRHIFPIDKPLEIDGPSCCLKDGKIIEPAREIPKFHETDVVVVGGGPAGFSAAVSAARAGAKVALVERYGSLGGLFTNGMVLIVLSTCRQEGDNKWTLVARGTCEEFMTRAQALGSDFCTPRSIPQEHWQATVDPEAGKYLMDRIVEEAKIDMFFHAWGVDVIQDGDKVLGVVFESKQGRQAILAKQVVDATGDADMLFRAGGAYKQVTHAFGFVSRWANMDKITATKPLMWNEVPGGAPLRGNEGNPSTYWTGTGKGDPRGNGLSVRELSAAEVFHRKNNWERLTAVRAKPGFEKVFCANTCSQIGPRASRLVKTLVNVDRAMLKAGMKVDDCIGWMGHDGVHAAWPVPFGAIVPEKVDNLLVAGRCLGTGDTIDTFRLIGPCFVTGQAAGIAAALAAKAGIAPRKLPYSTLAKELDRQGVYREV